MIRTLTPAEEARLLTPEAVQQLPAGTELWIAWEPYYVFRYRLGRNAQSQCTIAPVHEGIGAWPQVLDLALIGTQRGQHRCFLPRLEG